ncbi:hypothetical protein SAMN00790413_04190 [Deinococcus hopiensis KR-140]|uniref:Uncharacterized protein n=1 Tax=Deinococcus hopiensis KR-140 TaxID=695939 RepID=A0A1W1UPC3_9DEIO|nr:hypothetical protein SAMN00790413_04190 [Deinococcus hopiensis KR-140]
MKSRVFSSVNTALTATSRLTVLTSLPPDVDGIRGAAQVAADAGGGEGVLEQREVRPARGARPHLTAQADATVQGCRKGGREDRKVRRFFLADGGRKRRMRAGGRRSPSGGARRACCGRKSRRSARLRLPPPGVEAGDSPVIGLLARRGRGLRAAPSLTPSGGRSVTLLPSICTCPAHRRGVWWCGRRSSGTASAWAGPPGLRLQSAPRHGCGRRMDGCSRWGVPGASGSRAVP